MTAVTARRGRPKGTGLDDSHHLNAIAALICGSKDLKPTTAIRSLGITNPSTIRRLRDKFNSARKDLLATAKHTVSKAEAEIIETTEIPNAVPKAVSENNIAAVSCALKAPADPTIFEITKTNQSMAQKKTAKSKAGATRTKRAPTKSKRTSAAKTKAARTKAAPVNLTTATPTPITQDIVGDWLTLSAKIVTETTRTQLQILEATQSSELFREVQNFQSKALNAWLCSLTPQFAFAGPLKPIPTTKAS